VRFYLRGRVNRGITRLRNLASRAPRPVPVPLADALRARGSAMALLPLLEGRSNPERQDAVARYLAARGAAVDRHPFASFEGSGENLGVDVGRGDRVLVLIAHHDAVPGSPGANDNAAAVGVLLHLLERIEPDIPAGLRLRFLFTAEEERGYLGARTWVKERSLEGIVGVVSLELCGIGDSVVIWDAPEETAFTRRIAGALEGLGLRRDETWHQVGRIPMFGSDHRAFAAAAIPAYGLTIVPRSEAEALRQFVLNPGRSVLRLMRRRPVPFDTYHTARDAGPTVQAAALELTERALRAIVADLA
jgi:hypothetical protein